MSVEVIDGAVVIRDLRDATVAPLVFTPSEWAAFVEGVRRGEFDLPVPAQGTSPDVGSDAHGEKGL